MNSGQFADHILLSNCIFTARDNSLLDGFVAIKGDKIVDVGDKVNKDDWIGPQTRVHDLEGKLITPGYHDNHTFFTGTLLTNIGVNLTAAKSGQEAIQKVISYSKTVAEDATLYGYGWNHLQAGAGLEPALLDVYFPDRSVILFCWERHKCWMNTHAIRRYKFTGDQAYPEAMALLLQELVHDKVLIKEQFAKFSQLLASRGVTSIKDISFDDYYSAIAVALEELKEEGKLNVRVHFVSQPNLEPINFEFGQECREKYKGDFIQFQGYKIMTDGVVSNYTGDLLKPYVDEPANIHRRPVDYEKIRTTVLMADKLGYKCCITVEGDAALRKAVDILQECRRLNGVKDLRHSISDLELTTTEDIKRMAELDIIAEIYSQVLLLNSSYAEAYMRNLVGEERESNFFNYGTMLKEGVRITNGTDLPLQMPSVPDSIYAATARLFPDETPAGGWYPDRGLPVAEVLKAWTVNGAYHCFMEEKLGTLEAGNFADIAVLDQNVFAVPYKEMRKVRVVLTISNGCIIYDAVGAN